MELDVAPAGTSTAKVAPSVVASGQRDIEDIVAARLPIIRHNYARRAGDAVNEHVVIDLPCDRVQRDVSRDGGRLYVHAGAVIDVVEMAPERTAADAPGYAEGTISAGLRAGNEPAAGYLVAHPH